jgi:hypothetical protein
LTAVFADCAATIFVVDNHRPIHLRNVHAPNGRVVRPAPALSRARDACSSLLAPQVVLDAEPQDDIPSDGAPRRRPFWGWPFASVDGKRALTTAGEDLEGDFESDDDKSDNDKDSDDDEDDDEDGDAPRGAPCRSPFPRRTIARTTASLRRRRER